MTDTPKHVQQIQLELWLAKTPGERLLQFLHDNDILYKAILKAKEQLKEEKNNKAI
ncbi:hypothetical protein BH11BAC3_BH11BAC3_40440 [soil metagenome]